LSEIRKVITERVDELVLVHNWYNNEVKSTTTDLLHQKSDFLETLLNWIKYLVEQGIIQAD
jgi:hypothetical protein